MKGASPFVFVSAYLGLRFRAKAKPLNTEQGHDFDDGDVSVLTLGVAI